MNEFYLVAKGCR